ncbi:MAG: hypothetical protein A2504_17575 [Bdellovibrionales bacterium RIFOXYD12_FULL_39_22]|nr:MAG: hypothetical protein A2385_15275 [Bdellovibrionales bacterium RIFOXYB1_FULL_39_21]OFZ40630.1 MAG: hypothetical protein A2485_03490 [Bdellovibrionales bacterium RIFOXYC12_FULL_39_17]OFZ50422.1 MAG: hypothetical protein A2404_02575 [Bdellovibrionales bacterium RIFOXYC1_FULL_39_130]OFZ77681.1 MAG: hypothetical protein A2560_04945 [Bdellovibrionales bacterium RIFOXYD1_FULL_39_84]OFZ91715.1 MAG: hypothetical protein A2504_17575 [Bdellovibrionales bacterium RIFOXYD12_FULL_39_22]HLE13026.1 hy
MKALRVIIFWTLIALTLGGVLVGCSKEELKELEHYAREFLVDAEVNFCTVPPSEKKSNLKFIFVIDKSSSNRDEPTDYDGIRRYDALLNYLNNSISDEQVFYSLVNFSSEARAFTAYSAEDAGKFFVGRDRFIDNVENQKTRLNPIIPEGEACLPATPQYCSSDVGFTNYESALQVVYDRIIIDVNQAKNSQVEEIISSHYVVIFLSDGAPHDELGPIVDVEPFKLQAASIAAIATNNNYKSWAETVALNTAYYYGNSADDTARSLLQEMANNGNGDYYEFGGGQLIDYERFSTPIRNVKNSLKDIFVVNENVTWNIETGTIAGDRDGDGVSDQLEEKLGSDWEKKDSDENGVSDGVEYASTGRPCADTSCHPALANPFNSCLSFVKAGWAPGDPDKYIDQDRDGLNNCEEVAVLESSSDDFDTNDDWIPDSLAFRLGGIAYTAGIGNSGALLDPDFDGTSNYNELKLNTPANFNNDRINHLKTPKYLLTKTSDNRLQSCFNLKVTGIPAVGETNRLKVYLLEKSSIIDDARYFRTSSKSVSVDDDAATVKFGDADLK